MLPLRPNRQNACRENQIIMSLKKQFSKSKPVCKVTFTVDADLIDGAKEVAVLGEFNSWDPSETTMRKLKDGSFTKTIELNSKFLAAYNSRASLYVPQENYPLAVLDYSTILLFLPKDDETYNLRGVAYLKQSQLKSAIEDFTKVIQLNLDSVEGFNNRGSAYTLMEQYPKAIDDYTQSIKLNPKSGKGYRMRGVAYIKSRQFDFAIDDFTKAIQLNPSDIQSYFNRGFACAMKQDSPSAKQDWQKVIELSPTSPLAQEAKKNLDGIKGK